MQSIPTSTVTSTTTSLPTLPSPAVDPATSAPSTDLLAAMNPAMDAAFRVGRPTDGHGAAAILATAGSYVAGATATIDKLDEGIRRRTLELQDLQARDPQSADRAARDLGLLQRLRDRIALSIERVTETSLGTDRASEADASRGTSRSEPDQRAQRRREELELLEQRRLLLASSMSGPAHLDSRSVAGFYGAGATITTGG